MSLLEKARIALEVPHLGEAEVIISLLILHVQEGLAGLPSETLLLIPCLLEKIHISITHL